MSSGATSLTEKPADRVEFPADHGRNDSSLEANLPADKDHDSAAAPDPNASPRNIHGILVRIMYPM
jgi:hypothetical protein